jgi:hypothetical protein
MYHTVLQYCTVQYSTVLLYCTVQYCTTVIDASDWFLFARARVARAKSTRARTRAHEHTKDERRKTKGERRNTKYEIPVRVGGRRRQSLSLSLPQRFATDRLFFTLGSIVEKPSVSTSSPQIGILCSSRLALTVHQLLPRSSTHSHCIFSTDCYKQ